MEDKNVIEPKEAASQNQSQPAPKTNEERYVVSPYLYQLRKYFVYVLVGGLIISALVAIIAVLFGNTSDIVGKSFWTVVIIIIHSLIALGFISVTSTKQPNTGSAIVVNTLFAITVLSLITAMLGVWDIITDGSIIANQYKVYFTAIFVSALIYGLYQSTEADRFTTLARNTAVCSSLAAYVLLIPVLHEVKTLPDIYYRLLVATYIVVGVSTVITVIFHWYYMSQHPELRSDDQKQSKPLSVSQIIGRVVLIFLAIWVGSAFLMGILRGITSSF